MLPFIRLTVQTYLELPTLPTLCQGVYPCPQPLLSGSSLDVKGLEPGSSEMHPRSMQLSAQPQFFLIWVWPFHTHSTSYQTFTGFWIVSDIRSSIYLVYDLDFPNGRIHIWFNSVSPDPSIKPGITQISHTRLFVVVDEWVNNTPVPPKFKLATPCHTDLTSRSSKLTGLPQVTFLWVTVETEFPECGLWSKGQVLDMRLNLFSFNSSIEAWWHTINCTHLKCKFGKLMSTFPNDSLCLFVIPPSLSPTHHHVTRQPLICSLPL